MWDLTVFVRCLKFDVTADLISLYLSWTPNITELGVRISTIWQMKGDYLFCPKGRPSKHFSKYSGFWFLRLPSRWLNPQPRGESIALISVVLAILTLIMFAVRLRPCTTSLAAYHRLLLWYLTGKSDSVFLSSVLSVSTNHVGSPIVLCETTGFLQALMAAETLWIQNSSDFPSNRIVWLSMSHSLLYSLSEKLHLNRITNYVTIIIIIQSWTLGLWYLVMFVCVYLFHRKYHNDFK